VAQDAVQYPWLNNYPAFAAWDMPLPATPVFQILTDAAAKYPNSGCMEFLGKHWTYAETLAFASRVAAGLQERGVGKGTRIGLLLPNTPYYIVVYMGALMAGATVVNLNPLYAPRELERLVNDSAAEIIVTMDLGVTYPKAHGLLNSTTAKTVIVCSMVDALPFTTGLLFRAFKSSTLATIAWDSRHIKLSHLVHNNGKFTPVTIDPMNDVAVLQYTGGTTGEPKGAMLTHANITANVRQVSRWVENPEYGHERFLAALPFFHVFAINVAMLCAFEYGAEIVMMPRFDLKDCLKTIHKTRPTFFPAVPTIYTAINNAPDVKKYDLTSIKMCISGGAPLPVEIKREFEALTHCVVVEGYGLSETSPVVCTNPTKGVSKAGSVGLPMPGTIVEIRSPEENSVLGIGEKGEICVRGPQVMKGYWNKPKETADVMAGGCFHTGDIGTMDDEGYVFIVDRIKDMINASGYKIYPRMVEEAIQLHPAVEEVIVIGVPHPYRGQAPKAFIKLRAGMTATTAELRDFLKDKLSAIERPEEFEFRDELPKTLIGKLSKKDLEAQEKAKAQAAQGSEGAKP
jgi:long-chain acyl-CoA synthetase